MIKFSTDRVLLLHKYIGQVTGGSVGVRDEGLLNSALENVYGGFDGVEFYPSKEEKGARIAYNLITTHPFIDGNKRIGMYVMMTFLEVNGIRLECSDDDIVKAGMHVAEGTMGYEELLEWVIEHKE